MKFSLSVLLISILSYFAPEYFVWAKPYIIPLLIIIMLSMALTLTFTDFKRIVKQPKPILLGVLLQFIVMPLSAFLIGVGFGFDNDTILGMVLVGSVAGGTASNVMCFLSGGRIELSITMTAVSTLLSILVTPLLLELYMGSTLHIPVQGMIFGLLKIVFIPVIIGLVIRSLIDNKKSSVEFIEKSSTLISQVSIIIIIAIVVGLNQAKFGTINTSLYIAVILHNLIGLGLGYYLAMKLFSDKYIARTIAIEVAMQNSGLAVGLALKYFNGIVAIPSVLFSLIHNISGSIYAGYIKDK
ncbi:MAG: bile acid:sodium symporter family protein [Alphaproteobacteria bacterium]